MPYDPAELTVASVFLESDQVRVNGRGIVALTRILDEIGVSRSPITADADADGIQIFVSYERVGELDGDVVFRPAFVEPDANVLTLFDQLPAAIYFSSVLTVP